MIARSLDALNDPFMGIIVEENKYEVYGKFRPWLVIGTVLSAISLYFMFSVPRGMTRVPLWFMLLLLIYYGAPPTLLWIFPIGQ